MYTTSSFMLRDSFKIVKSSKTHSGGSYCDPFGPPEIASNCAQTQPDAKSYHHIWPEKYKEKRMKSKNLLAVVLGALIVFALSLPVMAQSTTQSSTSTRPGTPKTGQFYCRTSNFRVAVNRPQLRNAPAFRAIAGFKIETWAPRFCAGAR